MRLILIGMIMMGLLSFSLGCISRRLGYNQPPELPTKVDTYADEPDVLLPPEDERSHWLRCELDYLAASKIRYNSSDGFARYLQRRALWIEEFRQQCAADSDVVWYQFHGYSDGGGNGPWRIVEVRRGRLVRYDLHFGLLGKSEVLKSAEPRYTEAGSIEAEIALANFIVFAESPQATWLH